MTIALLRWVKAEADEQAPLVWSFLYFFCLLCGYYMLRPVRDEMAIEGGVQHLPWMMTGTFLTLLLATPVFGWLSSTMRRVRLLMAVYGFFTLHLVLFFAVLAGQWHVEWAARVFFVWLSVFNLFVVSVFWSFMADVFTPEQGARLFGVIAAGGSAGAMAGPVLTAGLTYVLPVSMLMLCAALWLVACGICIRRLDRWSRRHPHQDMENGGRSLGGDMWAGVRLAVTSPYLLGIGAYVLLLTMSATVLYLEQTALIGREISSPELRTRLFAGVDLTVNVLTFVTQVWVTNRLVLRWGLVTGLLVLPIVSAMGFLALGTIQVLAGYLLFTVLRRVGEYAIAKPTREVLFTVVSREEKYKAKNFIDTVVSRGGDAATGWAVSGIKALGASSAQLAWLLVPAMLLWGWIGWFLAHREARLQRDQPSRS
jgi:AAA family ATP:ADP antiporter